MEGGREMRDRKFKSDTTELGPRGKSRKRHASWPAGTRFLAKTSRSTQPSPTVTPFTPFVYPVISRHGFFTISPPHLLSCNSVPDLPYVHFSYFRASWPRGFMTCSKVTQNTNTSPSSIWLPRHHHPRPREVLARRCGRTRRLTGRDGVGVASQGPPSVVWPEGGPAEAVGVEDVEAGGRETGLLQVPILHIRTAEVPNLMAPQRKRRLPIPLPLRQLCRAPLHPRTRHRLLRCPRRLPRRRTRNLVLGKPLKPGLRANWCPPL